MKSPFTPDEQGEVRKIVRRLQEAGELGSDTTIEVIASDGTMSQVTGAPWTGTGEIPIGISDTTILTSTTVSTKNGPVLVIVSGFVYNEGAVEAFAGMTLRTGAGALMQTQAVTIPAEGRTPFSFAVIDSRTETSRAWRIDAHRRDGDAGMVGIGAHPLIAAEIIGQRGPAGVNGTNGADGTDGNPGPTGPEGDSAYEVAVSNGFVGTQAEWLESLKNGPAGPAGASGLQGRNGISLARVSTISNVNLANPGTDTFDDIAIVAGDALLLLGQSDPIQNGYWQFNGSASPLTRFTADPTTVPDGKLYAGTLVAVSQGTVFGNTLWMLSSDGSLSGEHIVDTDVQSWSQKGRNGQDGSDGFSGFNGRNGIYHARAVVTTNVDVTNPGTNVFDGYTMTSYETMLLAGQTDPIENGYWRFDSSSTPLTRTLEDPIGYGAPSGTLVSVQQGAVYEDTLWMLTSSGDAFGYHSNDTDPQTWTQKALDGATGPVGPAGPSGPSGPQNLYIQETDPGAQAFSYVWYELNPDQSLKDVWVYTP